MERKEIEAELNEVERDLADIARRAHIAASNLRSVADAAYGYMDADAWQLIQYATALDSIKADIHKMKIELAETKAALLGAKPATGAAGEGGAE